MFFFALVIIWLLFGLLFIPLTKDITGISKKWLLITISMFLGIPILFIALGINPKRFDLPDDILNEDSDSLKYPVSNARKYKSFDEYLESIHLAKGIFIKNTKNILEKNSKSKDIDGIFLDSDEWILEEINNSLLPYGVIPIGITVVGDTIGVDTQSKPEFTLLVIDLGLNPVIHKWNDNGNYPELEE